MTIFKYASAVTIVSVVFTLFASVLPNDAQALSAPTCVLNTIVNPTHNGGTTLSWKVLNAHTIAINNNVGNVADADSLVVYPSTTTTYTLTATGNAGVATCTATAQAVSIVQTNLNTTALLDQTCTMWVNPDFVVPGGTAIISWNAPGANFVEIDRGVGNVTNSGSRVVANTGVAQTFTLNARWGNGTTRTCSTTVRPTSGFATPVTTFTTPTTPAAPTYYGGVNTSNVFVPGSAFPVTTTAPQITATYTAPTTAYVSLAQVPYTGTSDVAYVLTLLAIALAAFATLYARRESLTGALLSFSPTDNDDFEIAIEQSVIHEA